MNKLLKRTILVILMLGVIVVATLFIPNVSKSGKTEYLLIAERASFADVMDSLGVKQSVFSTLTFRLDAMLTLSTGKFKTGRYELKGGMSNFELIKKIRQGRQTPIRITFNNIRTKEDLCRRLSDQLMFSYNEIYNLLNDNGFLSKYDVDTYTAVSIFIPDTYEVYWTITPEKLMDKIYKSYLDFWTTERREKARKEGLTITEVSTLASIVEEETNLKNEKPIVAGLYINRLRTGMKLQADPTVKFAVGDFTIKRILFEHIDESAASPYNTYKHEGLPPGPVRVPSIESIDAVLNYTTHPYLFMCAKGNGGAGHDFTVTFGEHVQNANRYRGEMDKIGIK